MCSNLTHSAWRLRLFRGPGTSQGGSDLVGSRADRDPVVPVGHSTRLAPQHYPRAHGVTHHPKDHGTSSVSQRPLYSIPTRRTFQLCGLITLPSSSGNRPGYEVCLSTPLSPSQPVRICLLILALGSGAQQDNVVSCLQCLSPCQQPCW